MKINFVIVDQCVLPVVYVDDEMVNLVHFTYHWHTMTDEIDSGISICVAEGYLHDSVLRRFTFDIQNDVVTQEIIEPEEDE